MRVEVAARRTFTVSRGSFIAVHGLSSDGLWGPEDAGFSQQPGRLTLSQHILWRPLSPQGSPWDVNLEARIVLEGGGLLEGLS